MKTPVTALTLFAGAGGWDTGFAACGVPILAALNHSRRSLATHALNFPGTRQALTDITQDDPTQYPNATIRAREVGALQVWKGSQPWGVYQEQYLYVCPSCYREVVPFYRPAKEVLNWKLPTPVIGQRKRLLAEKTCQNIQEGLVRYRSHSAFLLSYYGNAVYRSVEKPLGTVTTHDRHALITVPHPDASVEECGYRMLTFDESRHAMGYPDSFRFACSKTEALRQIGLSVTPAVAAMLVQRGLAVLSRQRSHSYAAQPAYVSPATK